MRPASRAPLKGGMRGGEDSPKESRPLVNMVLQANALINTMCQQFIFSCKISVVKQQVHPKMCILQPGEHYIHKYFTKSLKFTIVALAYSCSFPAMCIGMQQQAETFCGKKWPGINLWWICTQQAPQNSKQFVWWFCDKNPFTFQPAAATSKLLCIVRFHWGKKI